MTKQPLKILFVHQKLEPYVLKDLKILQDVYDVHECEFIGVLKTTPLRLLKDVWTLLRGVWWADLTFSWFGKLHAFFAVLFSKALDKRSIVVAGGEDVTKHKVGGKPYGLFSHPVKKWFAYFTFKWADCILSVSRYNFEETLTNAKVDPKKTILVYHGFDGQVFQKKSGIAKKNFVVTIGNIDQENYFRKGLKLFVESARLLPDVRFFLVGTKFGPEGDNSLQLLEKAAPENVTLTGRLQMQDLIALLNKASIYIQASEHEAFGCSLAEAMLCECVPVVSRNTALPEVVGDAGFYLDELSPQELAIKIREALLHPEVGKLARKRIIDNFPLTKRKDKLLQVVESMAMNRGLPDAS